MPAAKGTPRKRAQAKKKAKAAAESTGTSGRAAKRPSTKKVTAKKPAKPAARKKPARAATQKKTPKKKASQTRTARNAQAASPVPRWRHWGLRTAKLAVAAALVSVIASFAWVLTYRFVNPPVTGLMVMRLFESEEEGASFRKSWRDYEEISPHLRLAVIAGEDQRFPGHHGFDVHELKRAVADRRAGKALRGASTISQQLAKNVFLWPSRSWTRKGLEAYFTMLIEFCWSKQRIMEVYLNVVEMGNGVYGAESAAKTFFQKPASELNAGEAALIAAALPNPRERDPANPSPQLEERQQWILKQMQNLGGARYLERIEDGGE